MILELPPDVSLKEALESLKADRLPKMAESRREMYKKAAASLARSGIAERALREGQVAPDFALADPTGRMIRLSDLLKSGPAIVSFYRGQWCPFCNLELRALQRELAGFEGAGATLVAITPNKPEVTQGTVEELGLDFPVLSDHDNLVAKSFNLVFEMIPEHVAEYRKIDRDIGELSGTGKWELPVPATYVIDSKRVIRYAFVQLNHHLRAEPSDVVAAAAEVARAGAEVNEPEAQES